MEYQIMFEIDEVRKRLVLEHVKEEYGVSEQEFWCCWIVGEEYVKVRAATAELVITKLIVNAKKIREYMLSHTIAYGRQNVHE